MRSATWALGANSQLLLQPCLTFPELNILQKDYSPTPCRLTQTSLKGQQIANFILSLVSTVLLLLLGAGGPPSGLRAARQLTFDLSISNSHASAARVSRLACM